jgi:pilus assembly protein CpaC
MMRPAETGNRATLLLISIAIFLLFPFPGMGAGPERVRINPTNPENLTVTAGKSVILESLTPIKRFSIAVPQVADVLMLTPRQVYLTGRTPGVTSLSLWGEGDTLSAVFDVEVAPDVASLKEKLHKMFPDEKDIRVTPTRDGITLSGVVSSAASLSQVLSLAEAYAPPGREGRPDKEKVVNLLEAGGVCQVMLEVRVSEMTKTLARNLGINFNVVSASGKQFGLSLLDNLTSWPSSGFPANALGVNSSVNGILSFLGNGATWTTFIDALNEQDLLKVLAEPTLITMSGKRANFLVGGEYPVPVPQALTTGGAIITIQYKTYGVGLNFTPIVLGNGRINMEVAPEVSELDFTNAVSISGYIVPALTVRRTSTTVELADGQSFAIAGLLSEQVNETVKKFPLLGEIPVLGTLFRSSQFQKSKTELVIIVTPHLVKPVDMAKQTLPTDQFVEPDDLEFYLLGYTEGGGYGRVKSGAGTKPSGAGGGGLDGDFGPILP